MIPDLAQSFGDGRMDAIRRRVLRRQRVGGTPAVAFADRVRQRLQRRMRPAPRSDRPVPTADAQLLQSVLGKTRALGGKTG